MIQITPQMRVMVAVEPADFRKGIDGLARLCQEALEQDPFGGWVFVFRNRKATALKVLVYDGQAPVAAKVYQLQKLRCHLCGKVFTAQAPGGVGTAKYDATAGSMIALLKYGSGMPFNRMQGRGLFTSGVVSTHEGRRIALFFSGRKHAGENLKDVLIQRAADLAPPIQMCDALSRNLPAELETIVANCLAHGRRQFVDVGEHFPEQCRYVLEALAVIYRNDAIGRKLNLSPESRLLMFA